MIVVQVMKRNNDTSLLIGVVAVFVFVVCMMLLFGGDQGYMALHH